MVRIETDRQIDVEWFGIVNAGIAQIGELDLYWVDCHIECTLPMGDQDVLELIKGGPILVPAPVRTIYRSPEDSWVPFHREVAKRLMEEEMWKPEMRAIFGSLVTRGFGICGWYRRRSYQTFVDTSSLFFLPGVLPTPHSDGSRSGCECFDKVAERTGFGHQIFADVSTKVWSITSRLQSGRTLSTLNHQLKNQRFGRCCALRIFPIRDPANDPISVIVKNSSEFVV